jgi:hypothetical protein
MKNNKTETLPFNEWAKYIRSEVDKIELATKLIRPNDSTKHNTMAKCPCCGKVFNINK